MLENYIFAAISKEDGMFTAVVPLHLPCPLQLMF